MANMFTKFSTAIEFTSEEMVEKAIDIYRQINTEREITDDCALQFMATSNISDMHCQVIVYSEESGSLNDVATYIHRLVDEKLLTKGVFVIQWADTCDRPRVDHFGGSIMAIDLVTKRIIATHTSVMATAMLSNHQLCQGDLIKAFVACANDTVRTVTETYASTADKPTDE